MVTIQYLAPSLQPEAAAGGVTTLHTTLAQMVDRAAVVLQHLQDQMAALEILQALLRLKEVTEETALQITLLIETVAVVAVQVLSGLLQRLLQMPLAMGALALRQPFLALQ